MNITITGSLGYISTPLVKKLIKKGHSVTLISSNVEKKLTIEAMGAKAAIGNIEDVDFIISAFSGADAAYCMLAPYGNFGDPNNDANAIIDRADKIANNYVKAVERADVKRVVYLSSIGADMVKGAGLIIIHHNGENTLRKLPGDVSISFIRPSGFYKNLFAFVHSIKTQGIIAARYGENDINVFVSNTDIADAIIEELESRVPGRKVRYVASEELTCNEAAGILGAAIGKPDLKWICINNEQQLEAYKAHGMNESIALQFVEMNASIHSGEFFKEYNVNKPTFGKTKIKQFAQEFAAVYRQ